MRTATFLFLKTGLNLFKPGVKIAAAVDGSANENAISESGASQPLELVSESQASSDHQHEPKVVDLGVIYTGPRGGRYRLDEAGRKIYLKAG